MLGDQESPQPHLAFLNSYMSLLGKSPSESDKSPFPPFSVSGHRECSQAGREHGLLQVAPRLCFIETGAEWSAFTYVSAPLALLELEVFI